MSSLEDLRAAVTAAADSVTSLKASGGDPADIKAAVVILLGAKKAFADANGGIGVDGKPFSDGKKDKKKKKEGVAPPPKLEANAENAAKKAAKKAEKAAKKAAAKAAAAGGAPPPSAPSADKPPPAPAAVATTFKAPAVKAKAPAKKRKVAQFGKVEPLQLCFSPNDGDAIPFITIMCAALTGLDPDLKLKMDKHRAAAPALGTTGVGKVADAVVTGDVTCATYFLKTHQRLDLTLPLLGGEDPIAQAKVGEWVEYASKCKGAAEATGFAAGCSELVESVACALAASGSVFLTGSALTLADVAVFDALGGGTKVHPSPVNLEDLGPEAGRWFKLIEMSPATLKCRHLLCGVDGSSEFPASGVLDPLVSGCHMLEGALPFEVTTRFPPEPSGYLHIGHAKAVLLNDYYARRYKGKLIVRFDDTNPSKEKEEFQQSIVEDLGKLGVHPDVVTYTSDYFEQMKGYAVELIKNGLAFMDDTDQEAMQAERMARKDSSRRGLSVEDNIKYFELMCSGDAEGAKWCLRAKINMQSVNGTMRDPVLYRQNLTPHHRSGTTYKAYPTYDLACPIVDSVEGVSHALRTTEYNDRDEQYAWIQNALKLRRVRIHGFARMGFQFTELSKRKLTWFVENGHVTGWDDPRFPTVRGVVRRGINIGALRSYILGQGASRRLTLMEWSKFWAENKKVIDDGAPRYMCCSTEGAKKLRITNAPAPDDNVFLTIDCHPKFPELGKRLIKTSSELLVEDSDVQGVEVGEMIGLMRWGVCKVTDVNDDAIVAEFLPDGDVKDCKRKLTWLSESKQNHTVKLFEFDNLINKKSLEEEENFKDFINENNLAYMTVHGDAGMKSLAVDDVVQIERRGLYRVDKVYGDKGKGGKDVLGRGEEELVLFMIPDGKKKAMSSLSTKLEHR